MKGIYVIAIAFLAFWAVSAANPHVQSVSKEDSYQDGIPTVCPYPSERFPENTTTNLPHEIDCTKFYKCFIGKGIEQLCPKMIEGDDQTRLHYNRQLQVCDWPWQAGCTHCPERNRNGVYPPAFIKHETDSCTLYYECVNGLPQLRYCPSGTCFSRTCQACVRYRDGGECDDIPSITPTPTTPTITPVCRNGAKRSHDCDCAKYHLCENIGGSNDWYGKDCPDGLHFSPTRLECLSPTDAGCLLPWKQEKI